MIRTVNLAPVESVVSMVSPSRTLVTVVVTGAICADDETDDDADADSEGELVPDVLSGGAATLAVAVLLSSDEATMAPTITTAAAIPPMRMDFLDTSADSCFCVRATTRRITRTGFRAASRHEVGRERC
jgi:hypothetical protein